MPEATTHNVAAAEEQEKLTEKSYNGSEVTKSEHVLQVLVSTILWLEECKLQLSIIGICVL